jgi:hypothetical protein
MAQDLDQVLAVGNSAGNQDIIDVSAVVASAFEGGTCTANVSSPAGTAPGVTLNETSGTGALYVQYANTAGSQWATGPSADGTVFNFFAFGPSVSLLNLDTNALALIIQDQCVLQLSEYSDVASPVEGDVAWDFTGHTLRVYDGSAWRTVTAV